MAAGSTTVAHPRLIYVAGDWRWKGGHHAARQTCRTAGTSSGDVGVGERPVNSPWKALSL